MKVILVPGIAAIALLTTFKTTLHKQTLAALPPWAEELNEKIDGQAIGILKNIKYNEENNKLSMHVEVIQYLNPPDNSREMNSKLIEINVYNERQVEIVKSLSSEKKGTQDNYFLFSYKVMNKGREERFELITIDEYKHQY